MKLDMSRVAKSKKQSHQNHAMPSSRLIQIRKRGHKTIDVFEIEMILEGFVKMVVYK